MKFNPLTDRAIPVDAKDSLYSEISPGLSLDKLVKLPNLKEIPVVDKKDVRVLTAILDKVYQILPLSVSTITFLMLLNFVAIYLYQPSAELMLWLGFTLVLVIIRLSHYKSYLANQTNNAPGSIKSRLSKHYLFSVLSGALWGYAVLVLMPADSLPHQFILIMTIGGVIAGGSSSLALTPIAFLLYMVVSVVPMSIRLYFLDPDYSLLLFPFCYVYMFFMWRVCIRNGEDSLSNIIKTISLTDQERSLSDSRRRLSLQIESSPLGVVEWDCDMNITLWNPAAENIFGYKADEIRGHSLKRLIVDQGGLRHFELLRKRSKDLHGALNCKDINGKELTCEWTSAPLLTEDNKVLGFTSFIRDVSERVESEEFIRKKAFYDELTGLPNRHYFQDRLQQELGRVSRLKTYSAVFFIDLDNFKHINDSLGHDIGDDLLQQFSKRLEHRLRKFETVARFGGDEFVVLLEKLGEEKTPAQLLAAHVASSINAVMEKSFRLGGSDYRLTCSIGITLFNNDEYSQLDLLKQADLALYESKHKGRNTHSFFEKTMGNKASRHLELLDSLQEARERDEMWIVFQPKVDMVTLKLKGAEVLIRWQNDTLGFISPAEFIPILENSAMMSEVGFWIIDLSFSKLREWLKAGLWEKENRLSINISPRQLLSQSFVTTVKSMLKEYELDSQLIEFEITENVLVKNTDTVSAILKDLSDYGISFSIDDFGTGYSSLAYLKILPIDVIKIDKSFVDHCTEGGNDKAIVKSIMSICTELNITSVAEGVETEAQREQLAELGCDLLQGYLYSKPLVGEDMDKLLNSFK